MKQFKWIGIGLMVLILVRCGNQNRNEAPTVAQKIDMLEQKLFGQDDFYNETDALSLMELYIRFADSLPGDEKSPDYLFKAADISMFQQSGENTIGIYDRIIEHYPTHPDAVMSLFLKAYVFDIRLNDTAYAHQFYKEFVQKYPDHEFADDAEMAIKNLGKTPEELIREFESLNQ